MILRFLRSLLVFCAFSVGLNSHSQDLNLPALGDASSSIVSLSQEYHTGQRWLREFRRQAPVSYDPLTYVYLQDLIQRLSQHSQLQHRDFSLLLVDNDSFNAFAVPGNVIGINTGLFSFAASEDQLSSVIAHELAHLSQRHFARGQELRKNQGLSLLASLLGSLLLAVTAGPDAGIAAITASRAALIENQLKYSRSHEQEADRLGIETLAKAGMNPRATADMFQHLLVLTRYNDRLRQFDFLLTHPLSDTRVSDAFNQARQYPLRNDVDSLDFHIIKARLTHKKWLNEPKNAIAHFTRELKSHRQPQSQLYGLAMAHISDKNFSAAEKIITQLLQDAPQKLAFQLLQIDLLADQRKVDESIAQAENLLKLSPNSYPITMKLAELALTFERSHIGVNALITLTESNNLPNTPDVWLQLAELQGLQGDIAGVHTSRAEYYERTAAYNQAQKHLRLALPLLENKPQALAQAKLKLYHLENIKKNKVF